MTHTNTGSITIRPEKPEDYRESENMIRESFWDVYKPGCEEHLIIHKLRESPALIKKLALVACDGERVVGLVVCPKVRVVNEAKQEFTVLSLSSACCRPIRARASAPC